MKKPLISIIIPVFNHESFVVDCLNSVFCQTYSHLELIVIDDGSQDRSPEVVGEKLESSPYPTIFKVQENQGAHAAINRGIELAQGEYITILNSDDRYHSDRIKHLVWAAERSSSRFLFTRVRHIDADGEVLPQEAPHPYYYQRSLKTSQFFPRVTFELLRQNMAITTGNFFFHRSLYDEVGPFRDLMICHDWDFLLRVILHEDPLLVNKVLLDYRIHSGNITGSHEKTRREEIDLIISHYLEKVTQASNPRAPGPDTWEIYWPVFVDVFMDHLCQYSRTWALLRASKHKHTFGKEVPRAALLTFYQRKAREVFHQCLEREKSLRLEGFSQAGMLSNLYCYLRRRMFALGAWGIETLF
jgi:glycosyltransferase involved in cell wall biosynthesis